MLYTHTHEFVLKKVFKLTRDLAQVVIFISPVLQEFLIKYIYLSYLR